MGGWLRPVTDVALALALAVPAFAQPETRMRIMQTSPNGPAADIAVKDTSAFLSNVAFRQAADCLPVDAGTYDLKVQVAGTDTIALEVTGFALQNRVVYTVFATGTVEGEPPLMAMPSPDAQHSVLPWTGGLVIASLCLLLALVIDAMIVLGGPVLHRQSVRSSRVHGPWQTR